VKDVISLNLKIEIDIFLAPIYNNNAFKNINSMVIQEGYYEMQEGLDPIFIVSFFYESRCK
jgi:hypothetical protein